MPKGEAGLPDVRLAAMAVQDAPAHAQDPELQGFVQRVATWLEGQD